MIGFGPTELVFVRVVERYEAEYERDSGRYHENDESDVLQSLPGEPQERLWRLGRDVVRTERMCSQLFVVDGTAQTCQSRISQPIISASRPELPTMTHLPLHLISDEATVWNKDDRRILH